MFPSHDRMAKKNPNFIWRSKNIDWDRGYIVPWKKEPYLMGHLMVWKSFSSIVNHLYNTPNIDLLKKKEKWFKEIKGNDHVLWWVPKNHTPTLNEAKIHLSLLESFGPTINAFTFKKHFSLSEFLLGTSRV